MDLTREDHDGAKDPTKIHHLEEEEHHETGASKIFRKVKAKARKIKNSLTKHGQDHEHDQDVDEEDDKSDEQSSELHNAPVYESSAVRGGVTDQSESLSHASETNVPAPEKIIPSGRDVFPVVSSDYTRHVEPEPLQETSYGHEAQSDPVREAPSRPPRVSDLSDGEESRGDFHKPMTTPVSMLSSTEDVRRTFAPVEDEYHAGQQKVNIDDPAAPVGESDYLSEVSNYQSKVTDPTHEGGGETAVPEIAESLGRLKVTDESHDRKSGLGIESDFPTRSQEFEQESEYGTGKDSPVARFGGESGAGPGKVSPKRSFEFVQKSESGIDRDSSAEIARKPETVLTEEFSAKSHEFDHTIDSGIGEESELSRKPGTEQSVEFLAKSYEFNQEIESGIGKDLPTGVDGESETGLGEDYPARSHELGLKNDSEIGKGSPTGFKRESETGMGGDYPERSHELGVKNDFGIGKDSPTGIDGESETVLGGDYPARSHELGVKNDFGIYKDSPTEFEKESETGLGGDYPAGNHELGVKSDSGIYKDSPTGFEEESETGLRGDYPERSHELGVKGDSEIYKDSPTGFEDESKTGLGGDFPETSHELGVKNDSGIYKDSPMGSHGYGEVSKVGLETKLAARNDDMKVETELGTDIPSGTLVQFSPETEETRDVSQEPKPSTYTEQIGSATSFINDKAIAAKNAVASSRGYPGETIGASSDEQTESPVGKVAGTVAEKLTPVDEKDKETRPTLTTKLPVSGGGNGAKEMEEGKVKGAPARDYLAEKLTPGEEDKALYEIIAEKLNFGGGEKKKTTPNEGEVTKDKILPDKISKETEHEMITEEGKGGGGMVGKIKGAVTSWFGGATEEVKPKSPSSVEESSQ